MEQRAAEQRIAEQRAAEQRAAEQRKVYTMSANEYDFAVIGAGAAGLIATEFAVKLGARVVIMEKDRIGGDCTWTGCVPSKALLKVAKVAHNVRSSAQYGIVAQPPRIDMPQVREYLHAAIDHIYAGTTPDALRAKGMEVMFGAVQFLDAHTLQCGEQRLRARKILIATGAAPVIPDIPGLDQVPFSTYLDFFDRDRLPKSLVILGGGPVGVEMAQAYQRLGVQVTVFAERLLPKEEPEASATIQRVLEREGVQVVAAHALSVEKTVELIRVRTQEKSVDAEAMLVAVGRAPKLEGLKLEAAGIRFSTSGLTVNDKLCTSASNVYGAGDVLGGEQFSHLAGWQGFQAARNALLPGSNSGFSSVVPHVTFTDPEVAQVGLLESDACDQFPNDVRTGTWPLARIDRAVCDNDRDGFIKIVTKKDGLLLGATIVSESAGETIIEIVYALQRRMKVSDMASPIHPYPTYTSGVQMLATEMAMERAMNGFSGTLIRTASKVWR
jgi:pyruvate/2-oxoglutarate dehydrogenase complex dihydrolipoamide dehydrogenase (E3) component